MTIEKERKEKIEKSLSEVMKPGEQITAFRDDDGISVAGKTPSTLAEVNESLYGYLLTVEDAISQSDGMVYPASLITAGMLTLSLHLQWFDSFFGVDVARFQSFWFYLGLFIMALMVATAISHQLGRKSYRRRREELRQQLRSVGIERYRLLTLIAGDEKLVNLRGHLVKDDAL